MKKKRSSTQRQKPVRQTAPAGNQTNRSLTDHQQKRPRRQFWIIAGIGSTLILLLGIGLFANRWMVESRISLLRKGCEQAAREADWPKLERIARQWAELEPTAVGPWTMAASASRAMGDLKGCAAYLAQLPDAAPVEAFHELSLLQMETLVQPLAARQTCERALRQYPSDNESSLRLLFIHAMLCQRDKIASEAKRAIRSSADSQVTYAYLFTANWVRFANGGKLNRFWLDQDPLNEDFQVAAISHEALYHDPNSQPASDSQTSDPNLKSLNTPTQLDELRTRFPHRVELRMVAMSKFMQAGQVAELGELLELPSKELLADSRYWRYKGWYLAAQEKWSEASEAYQRALAICSYDFASQNELAAIVRRTQGLEASKDLQSKATLGIELELTFFRAANFEAVPQTDYLRLADYFEMCGETDISNGLRKHLR